MPDEIAGGGAAASTTQDTTTAPPAQAAPAQTATPAAAPPVAASAAQDQEPAWLKPRLDQHAKSIETRVLKELGVTDIAAAKAAIADANARAEATKTVEQKNTELTAKLAGADRATAAITAHAGRMLGALSDKDQKLVRSLAGDDAIAQLEVIGKLADAAVVTLTETTTTSATPGATVATAAPAQQAKPAPATTAPAAAAPPSASSQQVDHKSVYAELEKTNPVRAASYLRQHMQHIYPSQ